ncbi:hypothetical protein [Glaciecola sp. 1036]|uniref:hypothetical protein n=1 Tax=Alteromonadaceae TaxID=72275 RepID=UPI003CFF5254
MSTIKLEAVQWSSLKDIDDVEPLNEKDYSVLTELREVLLKHGYINRFGIKLLHRHFDISQDEIIMENTDVESRVSVLSVEKDSSKENTIETMWRFSDGIQA